MKSKRIIKKESIWDLWHQYKIRQNTDELVTNDIIVNEINDIFKNNVPDLDIENENNQTILFYACDMNNIELIKLLIENKVNLNYIDKNGNTVLHYAAKVNNNEILNLLLITDAKNLINYGNKYNNIPLHNLIENNGSVKNVILLIKYGSKFDVKNFFNSTPIDLFKIYYKKDDYLYIIKEFIKKNNL
jgi:ankyrin repeat protein